MKIKRISAMLLCVIMIMSCISCNANATWILESEGEKLSVGVYIFYLLQSEYQGKDKVDEALNPTTTTTEEETTEEETTKETTTKKGETTTKATTTTETTEATTETTTAETTETTTEPDYYKEKIDDKDFATWVKDTAIEKCKELLAIEKKFKEYKLSLSEEEESQVMSNWDNDAETCELNGISKKSYERAITAAYMKNKILTYYYGENGEEPIDEKTLKQALKDDYATSYVLQQYKIDTTTYQSYTDDILTGMRDSMKGFVDRLQKGEDYSKIETDFKAKMATFTESASDSDSEVKGESVLAETEDKPVATPNVQVLRKDAEDEITTAIFNAKTGKAAFVESDSIFCVYMRTDYITKNPYYYNEYKDSIISNMKSDSFDDVVKDWAKNIKVTMNNAATKAYTAKKLKTVEAE